MLFFQAKPQKLAVDLHDAFLISIRLIHLRANWKESWEKNSFYD